MHAESRMELALAEVWLMLAASFYPEKPHLKFFFMLKSEFICKIARGFIILFIRISYEQVIFAIE